MNDLDRLTDALTAYSARAVHAETRAALLETEVTALRAQLAERPIGGSGSGAVVLAEVPADWWIGLSISGHRSVMQPHPNGGGAAVISEDHVRGNVWAIFAAVLPDRGDCPDCTATPCPDHAETES